VYAQFLDSTNVETAKISILKILKLIFLDFPGCPKDSIRLSFARKKQSKDWLTADYKLKTIEKYCRFGYDIGKKVCLWRLKP